MNAAADQMRLPAVNDADPDATAMVARAMTAARAAQSRWSRTPLARRLELIRELRRLIAERALQLAEASASARKRPALESLTAEVLMQTLLVRKESAPRVPSVARETARRHS